MKNRFLVPAILVAAVCVGGLLALGSGAAATDHAHDTAAVVHRGCVYQTYGVTTRYNAGAPNSSFRVCQGGRLVGYGNSAISYKAPSSALVPAGYLLFQQYCASCHEPDAGGGTKAPNLRGLGPATVEFWVDTGRMPATVTKQVEAPMKPPKLTRLQAASIAAWLNSPHVVSEPATPFVPYVNLKGASLGDGQSLFALNCAACHTITGAGDALARNTYAPTLHAANAQLVAEAIRTGPANMPRFTGNLTDNQVRDIVAYVTERIQHPTNPGGNGLGGIGPVTEGFIGLLFGVGGLALVCFWIGDRAK